ncbi:MAG: hypothetical protein J6H21_03285 [Firmicutes bacterium]|nr:hypothetical protein [Bacillota bacterium]
MATKKYKIAERVIAVTSIYDRVHSFCRDYEINTNAPADFSVQTTPEDIIHEREKVRSEYTLEGKPVPSFSEELLEETAVYRKIAEEMVRYNTFVFHGSAVALDGEGYLFTAKSGTGKSTHVRLWCERLGDRAVMVNDDKPLLRVTDSGVIVYGSPYNGKHRLGSNISVPLKAIGILSRGDKNQVQQITKRQAYAMLVQQSYHPVSPEKMKKTLELLDIMAEKVAIYQICCTMEPEAAEIAYQAMK